MVGKLAEEVVALVVINWPCLSSSIVSLITSGSSFTVFMSPRGFTVPVTTGGSTAVMSSISASSFMTHAVSYGGWKVVVILLYGR